MRDALRLARIFKALSVEARVQILLLLKEKALCVNALAARLGMTSSAVSQHLRILRAADLVTPDKQGYFVHYALNRSTLRRWKGLIDRLLETGQE